MKPRKPAHWDYTKRTSQEQALTGKVDRETKIKRLRDDVEALEAIQFKRALKPPGRR